MGLDWVLHQRKAIEGKEEEFDKLSAQLNASKNAEETKRLETELNAIAISAFEVLGAPRVGIDEAATKWFKEEVYEKHVANVDNMDNEEYRAYWLRPWEQVLASNHGVFVPHLATETDGLARIVGIAGSQLDFCGNVVGNSEKLIGKELADRAYQDHGPKDMLDYAAKLSEQVEQYRDAHTTTKTESEDLQLIDAAILWLTFWGERGFGFWAWY